MTLKEFSTQIRDNIKSKTQNQPVNIAEKILQLEKENEQLKSDNQTLAIAVAEIAQTVYGGASNG